MLARRLRRRAGCSTVTLSPQVTRCQHISSMPPAVKRTVSVPSAFSSSVWLGWKRKAAASRFCLWREAQHRVHAFLLEGAEGAPGVGLQIEAGVAGEGFAGHVGLAHVTEPPQPHGVVPVRPPHQEGAVAVEQAVGLDALAAVPARGLRQVADLDDAAGGDGLAQAREQVPVEARPGAGTHGEPLGLHQRLDVGLDPRQRVGSLGGAQLGAPVLAAPLRAPRSQCAPGSRLRTSSSASSSAERGARRRSASERSRQWRLLSPPSAISSGPKAHSTASRMRSAVFGGPRRTRPGFRRASHRRAGPACGLPASRCPSGVRNAPLCSQAAPQAPRAPA